MDTLQIGSRREVCWDTWLMDSAEGVQVRLHKPQFRNEVLQCDAPWEGNGTGTYASLVKVGDTLRLYYRGYSFPSVANGKEVPGHTPVLCLAESRDGKAFTKVSLQLEAFRGQRDNNIIPFPEDACQRGSFFVFCDTKPDCPDQERYKALVELSDHTLAYFKSADGIRFEWVRVLVDDGAYDSLNIAFWDDRTQQYFLFYRGVHGGGTVNGKWAPGAAKMAHNDNIVRDIRVRTSKDFVTWDTPRRIRFDPERDDVDLYINNIQKYYRAEHMFIGFPVRYMDRYTDPSNIPQLPGRELREHLLHGKLPREATVITDALVMTSRDGDSFRRTEEAFLTPGVEGEDNWIYGDCYFTYGMVETASDIPGAPNELSMYAVRGYRSEHVRFWRYSLRLDGFFSWHSDYTGGKVLTKPLIFSGNSLRINFATSGAGSVQIRLTDPAGNPLEGYDSGRLFGDSVERRVQFEKPLEALSGQQIRMEIFMKDADLYAFQFNWSEL